MTSQNATNTPINSINSGDTILNSAAASLAEYIQCLGGPVLK